MRFLITAGPTREYLDPVRFISNPSSGRMGLALARAALGRGHKVTLILGPVHARLPQKARIIHVQTTDQMAQACFKHFPRADCVIMSAAVCDYQPAKARTTKIKKSSAPLTLKLKPTTDILAQLARRKRRQLLIGFALETDHLQAHALAKLKKKKLDYIIANSPASLASEQIKPIIISADGSIQSLRSVSKLTLARKIIRLAEVQFAAIHS
ncbi:MAG: phosphopantothenoylcysteine decarboxylase [Phycisphaerae bacterium]|nr:phosphopantothenoylcysteine decarboxylase [Phycisphaerae bacterium]